MHKHDCEKSVDGSAVLERAIGSDLMYESSIGSLEEKNIITGATQSYINI